MTNKANDIIKEIDPDYQRCDICGKYIVTKKSNNFSGAVCFCKDISECANRRKQKEEL